MSVDLVWRPVALLPLAWIAIAWGLALLVLLRGRGTTAGHLLATILALEGVAFAGDFAVATLSVTTRPVFASAVVSEAAIVALLWLYLAFFGIAFATPMVAWLRRRGVRRALIGAAAASAAGVVAAPHWFIDGVGRDAMWGVVTRHNTPLHDNAVWWAVPAVMLFGFVAAWSSLRRGAAGTVERGRARSYLMAFGVRDGAFVGVALMNAFALWITGAARSDPVPPDAYPSLRILAVVFVGLMATYYGLLAYGVLRGRILDIDLRIKWTLRRGTLVGIFIATFYVVTILAENFFQRYGLLFGSLAAGLLLFALAPLQRFADRVADKAMPDVKPVASLDPEERRRLFHDLAASAWADGTLTREERRMLGELRERLGLTTDEAEAIEREVAAP